MKSYYEILGVDRNAEPETIKKAYRKLASLYHPDKEGGSKIKFQELEEAYRTLGDPNKRAQYDNPSPFGSGGPGFGRQENPFDIDAIFSMFGARFHHPHQQQTRRAQMSLWVTLEDIAKGGQRTISVGTHHGTHAVEIEIPQGIEDGTNVQYPGIGPGGIDLLIAFRIHPSAKWQRHGQNLIIEHTVSVWDLILGCTVEIKDILGSTLELSIPAKTQPGSVLRLRGRGLPSRQLPAGDLLIKVQAEIPSVISPELIGLIEKNRA